MGYALAIAVVVGVILIVRWAFRLAPVEEKSECICPGYPYPNRAFGVHVRGCPKREPDVPDASEPVRAPPPVVNEKFVDDRCDACGHDNQVHSVYTGKCFQCGPKARCVGFVSKKSKQPDPVPPRTSYVDAVLNGESGPSGIPGGFPDTASRQRYTDLVHQADTIEREARSHAQRLGGLAIARSEVGLARALRDAAQRLLNKEDPIEASDGLVADYRFKSREQQLDENVREAERKTREATEK